MLKKWHIITLVLALALLSITTRENVISPNQEIVLQFSDIHVNENEVKNTITLVKKQLEDLGAGNIEVKNNGAGVIKITYHSVADISIIKEIFSKDDNLDVDYKSHSQGRESNRFPANENSISYNLDVFEIENETDWGLNGIHVVEFDSKSNHFFDPNPYLFSDKTEFKILNNTIKVAYAIRRYVAFTINNNSKSIPTGRAGPLS